MQIRYTKSGEVEHVGNDVGRFAIKTGLAEEVIPTPTKQPGQQPNRWAASEGRHASLDYQFPPFIVWSCGACSANTYVENPSDGFVGRHCGIAEKIPSHVRAKYNELTKAYKARSRRKNVSPIALVTATTLSDRVQDLRILNHFGIKSKEQLILQAQSDAELARRIASKK